MKFNIVKSLCIAATAALVVSSQATAYLIAEVPSPNSGDQDEINLVIAAIAAFNLAGNPPAPIPALNIANVFQAKTDVAADLANYIGVDDKSLDWTAPNGDVSFYVLAKWGQGQANFDTSVHFVTPGNTLAYNPGGDNPPNGLSHIWIWHTDPPTVPDGGATLGLLTAGLLATGAVRRFRK